MECFAARTIITSGQTWHRYIKNIMCKNPKSDKFHRIKLQTAKNKTHCDLFVILVRKPKRGECSICHVTFSSLPANFHQNCSSLANKDQKKKTVLFI